MRRLDTIVIHYTATPPERRVTVDEIRSWHKARNFRDIGYHYVVHQDGTIERGRPVGQIGAHVRGHNTGSIGLCYVGGLVDGRGADTRTPEQRQALRAMVAALRATFGELRVVGHRDLAATECPGFDVQAEDWPIDLIRSAV